MKAFISKNQSQKLWERCKLITNYLNFNIVNECAELKSMSAIKFTDDSTTITILEFRLEDYADCICITIDCQKSNGMDGMLCNYPQIETQFIEQLFRRLESIPKENEFKLQEHDYVYL